MDFKIIDDTGSQNTNTLNTDNNDLWFKVVQDESQLSPIYQLQQDIKTYDPNATSWATLQPDQINELSNKYWQDTLNQYQNNLWPKPAEMNPAPDNVIKQWNDIWNSIPWNDQTKKIVAQDYLQNISNRQEDLQNNLPSFYEKKYWNKTQDEILAEPFINQVNKEIINPLQEAGALPKEWDRYIEALRQWIAQNEIIASHTDANNKDFTAKGFWENVGYWLWMAWWFLIDLIPINKALQIAWISAKLYQGANILWKTAWPVLWNMLEQGLWFATQWQLVDKEHKNRLKEAVSDFAMWAMFPLIDKAGWLAEMWVEKAIWKWIISESIPALTVAWTFYWLGKMQWLDDASALWQAITFWALHQINVLTNKSPEDGKIYEQSIVERLFDWDKQSYNKAMETFNKSKSQVKYYYNFMKEFAKTPEAKQIKEVLFKRDNKIYWTIPWWRLVSRIADKTPEIFNLFKKWIEKVDTNKLKEEQLIWYLQDMQKSLEPIDKKKANDLWQLVEAYKLNKEYSKQPVEKLTEQFNNLQKNENPFDANNDTEQLKKDLLAQHISEKSPNISDDIFKTANTIHENIDALKADYKSITRWDRYWTEIQNKQFIEHIKQNPVLKDIYETSDGKTPNEKIRKFLNLKPKDINEKVIDMYSDTVPEIKAYKHNKNLMEKFNTKVKEVKKTKQQDKKVQEVRNLVAEVVSEKDVNKVKKVLSKYKRKSAFKWDTRKFVETLTKQPTAKQIEMLIKKYWFDIVKDALDEARFKNILNKKQNDIINTALEKAKKSVWTYKNNKWKGLTHEQEMALTDMTDYKDIWKTKKEKKINQSELSKYLKKDKLVLELVEPNRDIKEIIPFTLLWNKQHTYQNHLLPLFLQAIKNWKTIFNEPFWGAWLSVAYLDRLFNAWLEKANINIFDIEKYITVKYLHKYWYDEHLSKLVEDTKNNILTDMEQAIRKEIPWVWKYLDEVSAKFWTKDFVSQAKEISMLYPELAKTFFKENPDAKLAKEWNLTTTFTDWLKKKAEENAIEKYWEKKWETIDKKEKETILDTAVEKQMDSDFIEKHYPKLNKILSEVLDKYEKYDTLNPDNIEWSIKDAIETALSRKYRFTRSWTWQWVFEASKWFKNLEWWGRKKFVIWLKKYAKNLQQYKDKVELYNMDWWEFIKKISKEEPQDKSFYYLDPPYLRTTWVYIKNMKDETAKKNLEKFADPEKFKEVVEPIKDTTTVLTNDINWKYFDTLKKTYWDKLNDRIIWYVEWVTPTSLVTTSDIHLDTSWFSPYLFIKKVKRNIDPLLDKKDKISKAMRNVLEKTLKEVANWNKKLMEKIQEINKGVELAGDQLEQTIKELEDVATWKEARQLVSKIRKEANKWTIRGKDFIRMINAVDKVFKEKEKSINRIHQLQKKIKASTFDADMKQHIEKELLSQIDTRKNWVSLKKIELINEYIKDWKRTPEHIEAFKYYEEQLKKGHNILNNIYYMNTEKLNKIIKSFEDLVAQWDKWKKYWEEKTKEAQDNFDNTKIETSFLNKKHEWYDPDLITKIKLWSKNAKYKAQELFIKSQPIAIMMEDLWMYNLYKKYIIKPQRNYRNEYLDYRKNLQKLQKEFKINKESNRTIALYWLLHRWDWLWLIKIKTYLTEKWDPLNPNEEKKFTEKQAEEKIGERLAKDEQLLTKSDLKAYKEFQKIFNDTYKMQKEASLKIDNQLVPQVENYRPIVIDYEAMKDNPKEFWKDTTWTDIEIQDYLHKWKIDSKNAYKATTKNTIPELDTIWNALRVWENVIYYKNVAGKFKQWKQWTKSDNIKNTFKNTPVYSWMENITNRIPTKWNYKTNWRWMEKLLNNFVTAVIWFNPTIVALQPTWLIDAITRWASLWIFYDTTQVLTNSKLREEILSKSNELNHREWFDPIMATDEYLKSSLSKLKKVSFMPMIKVDKLTAMAVWKNFYDKAKYEWKTETDAIDFADQKMNQAMANPHFEDSAEYIYNARWYWKVVGMFQTFVANRFANWYRAVKDPIKKKQILVLFRNILLIWTALSIEQYLMQKSYELQTWQKHKPNSNISIVMWYIPLIWTLFWIAKYGFPWPFSYIQSSMEDVEKQKDWTKILEDALKWLWYTIWIPWTSTAGRLFKRIDKKSTKKTTTINSFNSFWDNSFNSFWDNSFDNFWNSFNDFNGF